MAIKRQSEIDGSLVCPECGAELSEANCEVVRNRVADAELMGEDGNVWLHAEAKCLECGATFEVGGQVGVTGK